MDWDLWQDLADADKIKSLRLLESEKTGDLACAKAVLGQIAANQQSFWVTAKLWICLGRLQATAIGPEIFKLWPKLKPVHWQLLALDTLWQLKPEALPSMLQGFLPNAHPLVLRSLVWLWGQLGGLVSAKAICQIMLKPEGNWVKADIVWDAWQRAARGLRPEQVAEVLSDAKARAWVANWLEQDLAPKSPYTLLPSSDYLWLVAKSNGLSQKQFAEIFWWQKRKHKLA